MTLAFQRIGLIGKRRSEDIAKTLSKVAKHLQKLGCTVLLEEHTAPHFPKHNLPLLSPDQLSQHCDLLVVVGGDGSLLSAARVAARQGLPVLGINRGRLGFLTDISPNDLKKIDDVLAGKYVQEERFLLETDVQQDSIIIGNGDALNDVVLWPGDETHMSDFDILAKGKLVCSLRADGLIVSTPTGSTAYALSSGGPILHPRLNAILLVPMCSHNLTSRPIVLNGDNDITIVIAESNRFSPRISCDGQTHITAPPGSHIHIRKQPDTLHLIHPEDHDFFETLRGKLHWGKQL